MGRVKVLSIFFYTVGHSVRIPLLDFQNRIYCEKIGIMASYVSGIIRKWETFCFPVGDGESSVPENLAYSLRKLAEMLPSAKLAGITKQTFYKKALSLSEGQDREEIEESVELLCSGFAEIQGRLDLGLEPFPDGTDTARMTRQTGTAAIFIPKATSAVG